MASAGGSSANAVCEPESAIESLTDGRGSLCAIENFQVVLTRQYPLWCNSRRRAIAVGQVLAAPRKVGVSRHLYVLTSRLSLKPEVRAACYCPELSKVKVLGTESDTSQKAHLGIPCKGRLNAAAAERL